jgi:hypothetical protein
MGFRTGDRRWSIDAVRHCMLNSMMSPTIHQAMMVANILKRNTVLVISIKSQTRRPEMAYLHSDTGKLITKALLGSVDNVLCIRNRFRAYNIQVPTLNVISTVISSTTKEEIHSPDSVAVGLKTSETNDKGTVRNGKMPEVVASDKKLNESKLQTSDIPVKITSDYNHKFATDTTNTYLNAISEKTAIAYSDNIDKTTMAYYNKIPFKTTKAYHSEIPIKTTTAYYEEIPDKATETYHNKVPVSTTTIYNEEIPVKTTVSYYNEIPVGTTSVYHEEIPIETTTTYNNEIQVETANAYHTEISTETANFHHSESFTENITTYHSKLPVDTTTTYHSEIPVDTTTAHHSEIPVVTTTTYHSEIPVDTTTAYHSKISVDTTTAYHSEIPIENTAAYGNKIRDETAEAYYNNFTVTTETTYQHTIPDKITNTFHTETFTTPTTAYHGEITDKILTFYDGESPKSTNAYNNENIVKNSTYHYNILDKTTAMYHDGSPAKTTVAYYNTSAIIKEKSPEGTNTGLGTKKILHEKPTTSQESTFENSSEYGEEIPVVNVAGDNLIFHGNLMPAYVNQADFSDYEIDVRSNDGNDYEAFSSKMKSETNIPKALSGNHVVNMDINQELPTYSFTESSKIPQIASKLFHQNNEHVSNIYIRDEYGTDSSLEGRSVLVNVSDNTTTPDHINDRDSQVHSTQLPRTIYYTSEGKGTTPIISKQTTEVPKESEMPPDSFGKNTVNLEISSVKKKEFDERKETNMSSKESQQLFGNEGTSTSSRIIDDNTESNKEMVGNTTEHTKSDARDGSELMKSRNLLQTTADIFKESTTEKERTTAHSLWQPTTDRLVDNIANTKLVTSRNIFQTPIDVLNDIKEDMKLVSSRNLLQMITDGLNVEREAPAFVTARNPLETPTGDWHKSATNMKFLTDQNLLQTDSDGRDIGTTNTEFVTVRNLPNIVTDEWGHTTANTKHITSKNTSQTVTDGLEVKTTNPAFMATNHLLEETTIGLNDSRREPKYIAPKNTLETAAGGWDDSTANIEHVPDRNPLKTSNDMLDESRAETELVTVRNLLTQSAAYTFVESAENTQFESPRNVFELLSGVLIGREEGTRFKEAKNALQITTNRPEDTHFKTASISHGTSDIILNNNVAAMQFGTSRDVLLTITELLSDNIAETRHNATRSTVRLPPSILTDSTDLIQFEPSREPPELITNHTFDDLRKRYFETFKNLLKTNSDNFKSKTINALEINNKSLKGTTASTGAPNDV